MKNRSLKITKVLIILLVLSLFLSGCTEKRTKAAYYNSAYVLKLLKEYQPRPKDRGATVINEEFAAFETNMAKELIAADYLFMRYAVRDYRAMGLKKPEVNLGKISYGADEAELARTIAYLEELQSFDYGTLAYAQQYDYEALEYSLYETLASELFSKYESPISIANYVMENLVTNLTSFRFYDEEAADDYVLLIKDVTRFIADLTRAVRDGEAAGLHVTDESLAYCQEFNQRFVSKVEDNVLITTYAAAMESENLALMDGAKASENLQVITKTVTEEIIPCIKEFDAYLSTLYGQATNADVLLSAIDGDYAEFKLMLNTSYNKAPEAIWQLLKDDIARNATNLFAMLNDEESSAKILAVLDNQNEVMNLSSKEALAFMEAGVGTYFPKLAEVDYQIKDVDASSASGTVKAYYVTPPFDDVNQNVIYVNPHNNPGADTYLTLAHEGIPGHLYQNCYALLLDQNLIRQTISFYGYTEGYATYAQRYGAMMAGLSEEEALACNYLFYYYFDIYGLIDIGIQYFDWTVDDIVAYFTVEKTGLSFEKEDAQALYDYLVCMPGVYCRYAVGAAYLNSKEIEAKNILKDKFSFVDFHRSILEQGGIPLCLLEQSINDYLNS